MALPAGVNQVISPSDAPLGYGVDILWQPVLDLNGGLVSGPACLTQDLMHLQMTIKGSLYYDQDVGIYLPGMILGSYDMSDGKQLAYINATCEQAIRSDSRVQNCKVTSSYDFPSETLTLNEAIAPFSPLSNFSLVLALTGVTLTLLGITTSA